MPELPEVETTRRGIAPHLEGQSIQQLIIRQPKLRWPVPMDLPKKIKNQTIKSITRRAKYLILNINKGYLLIHLGMSGKLCVIDKNLPKEKHSHIDLILKNNQCLRYTDPRRFGAWLWWEQSIDSHPLLAHLGPEPLDKNFNTNYLYKITQNRQTKIKPLIMEGKVVVGVGNIYACESLFKSGIHPSTPAKNLSKTQISQLTRNIKFILKKSIQAGGTTLKDFTQSDGKPGYFTQELFVYGREGQPCHQCTHPIEKIVLGQRSSFYCPQCQLPC